MTSVLVRALRAVLRTFYRQVEVEHPERLPTSGPVVVALNHPNSLLDPVVLLALSPRPMAILAAEPLFRKPVLGRVVRAVGAIPVYRREDAADRTRNRSTFAAAREHLAGGGALAIFPEGVSHDDPSLRPMRTGAARIALGAGLPVTVVPGGLFYTARHRFRSEVLLCFGTPLPVHPGPPGPDGEPDASAVQDLTTRLEAAIGALTLQADQHKALRMAEAAERIFSSASNEPTDLPTLRRRRQRFVRAYERLRRESPATLARLEARTRRYHRLLRRTGLDPEQLPPRGHAPWEVVRLAAEATASLALLLPVAAVGIVVHFPAWWLTRRLALGLRARARRGEDVVGTFKVLIGLGLYGLTWTGVGAVALWRGSLGLAIALTLLTPLTGAVALVFTRRFAEFAGLLRAASLAVFGRGIYRRLLAERLSLRTEFARLAPPPGPAPGSRPPGAPD